MKIVLGTRSFGIARLDNLLAMDGRALAKSATMDERFLGGIRFPPMDWWLIGSVCLKYG